MRLLRVSGDHRAIGRQHGAQAQVSRPTLVRIIDSRLAGWNAREGELAAGYVEAVRRYAPATARMLEGIAEGLDLDVQRLWSYTASGWVSERLSGGTSPLAGEGCTAWAVAGTAARDGAPLLAKNRDYYRDHRDLQVLTEAEPASGYRWLAIGSLGSPGVFSSGINERGLCLADTHVPSRDLGPGTPRYAQMLDALERCATVGEAIALLGAAPAAGGGNLVLADRTGDVAVCELSHGRMAVRSDRRVVVATNHFVSPGMRRRQVRPRDAFRQSVARRARVAARLRAGEIDPAAAEAIMARHGTRESAICRHAYPTRGGPYGTISSVVYLPTRRELRVADAWPCTGPFRRLVAGTDFWIDGTAGMGG